MGESKVPISVKVSYGLLRDWMMLPSDVDLLGISGAQDSGACFTVILETPVRHIKGANLTAQYCTEDGQTKFDGFV